MKNKFNTTQSEQIAVNNLSNEVVKINATNPFTWTSKKKCPIYANHRKDLSIIETREMYLEAMMEIIKKKHLRFDAIFGVPTAGVPWAAMLARKLDKPLIMAVETKNAGGNQIVFFKYDLSKVNFTKLAEDLSGSLSISTNETFGLPIGACLADIMKLPFMYVRKAPKQHGSKDQIEGFKEGIKSTSLVNFHNEDDYLGTIHDALKNLDISMYKKIDAPVYELDTFIEEDPQMSGQKILIMDDLLSTAESSIKYASILASAEHEAIIEDILTLFNYELPESTENLSNAELKAHTVLTYNQLIEIGVKEKLIPEQDLAVLKEWKKDPKAWAEKYFPSPSPEPAPASISSSGKDTRIESV